MVPILQNKTAIITGAASGQGRAAALLFASAGVGGLALCDVNAEGLAETAKLVEAESNAAVLALRTDMGDVGSIASFAKAVVEQLGVVDVIYNNAGIGHASSIEETTEEDWDKVHAVNVKGPFFLVKYALPALTKSESGSVINVSSVAGLIAPADRQTVYVSSKGALIALTRAQARDLAPFGVRVNCLVPGAVDTPMATAHFNTYPADEREAAKESAVSRTILKRWAQPEEVASMALFLASPSASYITGAVIPIDGGFTVV